MDPALVQICYSCKQEKPLSDFWKDKTKRLGVGSECKDCHKQRKHLFRKENKEEMRAYYRRWHLQNKYGLTIDQYRDILNQQDGKCGACGSTHRLVIDHCHTTGTIRGILCDNCNKALGQVHDSTATLRGLIDWIEKH